MIQEERECVNCRLFLVVGCGMMLEVRVHWQQPMKGFAGLLPSLDGFLKNLSLLWLVLLWVIVEGLVSLKQQES